MPGTPLSQITTEPSVPILFFDGDCGFCRGSVAWVASKDREGILSFAPLGGETAAALGLTDEVRPGGGSAVLVDAEKRVHRNSEAVLRALKLVGGFWGGLSRLGLAVPRVLRDPVYRLVARVRRWLPAGKCVLPAGRVLG
ncbi:thiol-disulfide oxidoreductase DCC family protein [Mucisphaera sp.]|uniref:thiol-disulfide oxidoreductase DCC family protein n=1 Tax=Mucisphaera sp. TaxID=2913024 RepID=UPI003D12200D